MFSKDFLEKVVVAISKIDMYSVELMVSILEDVRREGRLFVIGSGGGAGHSSHAVCDFRKLCNFDALSFDNISELTARVNDEGWDTSYLEWMKASRFNGKDGLLIISVGGGTETVSQNLVKAMRYARSQEAPVLGIVGKDGGLVKKESDAYILIQADEFVTPITEGLQSIIWHLLVTHPKLAKSKPIW